MPEISKPAAATVLPVRLPPATKRLLDRAAARRHKSTSGFMRDAAIAEANRVLGIEPESREVATTPVTEQDHAERGEAADAA